LQGKNPGFVKSVISDAVKEKKKILRKPNPDCLPACDELDRPVQIFQSCHD